MEELKNILILIDKLNISKVALASYLNVSRQMVYNYLSMNSIDEWPLDKKIRILELFGVKNTLELEKITVNTELLETVRDKLNSVDRNDLQVKYNRLDARSKRIIDDVISICDDKELQENLNTLLTLLEYSLISEDYKYLITYLSKVFKKCDPRVFGDNKERQMSFEGILFSAFNLFNSGKFSKEKTQKVHEELVREIEKKSELDTQATNVINVTKIIAKKELGIDSIDETNIDQVLEKMLEIQGRKL